MAAGDSPQTVKVTIRVPTELYAAIQMQASADHRSTNQQMTLLLDRAMRLQALWRRSPEELEVLAKGMSLPARD